MQGLRRARLFRLAYSGRGLFQPGLIQNETGADLGAGQQFRQDAGVRAGGNAHLVYTMLQCGYSGLDFRLHTAGSGPGGNQGQGLGDV